MRDPLNQELDDLRAEVERLTRECMRLTQMCINREEFIAEQNLWREFSEYLAKPVED